MQKLFSKRNKITKEKVMSFFIVVIFLMSVIFSPIFSSRSQAVFNKQINYQGKLTTSAGVAVANGSYNMEFKLYTVATGGSAIWTETRINGNRVTITNGLFSVMLGDVSTLSGVDFNQTLYLGINIGGTAVTPTWDTEMTPRKKIGAVPAAVESENSSLIKISDDAATSGAVYPTWSSGTSGNQAQKVTSTKLSFVPSTGILSSTGFSGTFNNLTLTPQATGFTIAGGTVSKTLTVSGDATVSGSNLGDETQATIKTKLGAATTSTDGYLTQTDWDTFNNKVSMIYPGVGIPNSNGNAWGTSYTTIGSGTVLALATTPTFTTNITTPLVVGGTSTTQDLSFKTTSGTGTTGADMHFLVGANGGTEAMTILNSGNVGIGTNGPSAKLSVSGLGNNTDGLFSVGSTSVGADGTLAHMGYYSYWNMDSAGSTFWNWGARYDGEANQWVRTYTSTNNYLPYTRYGTDGKIAFGGAISNLTTDANPTMSDKVFFDMSTGNVGIGQTLPSAALHLKAGTATANTAPLKFAAGTNLGTAETGAMEYDGTELYFTPTGTTRETIAYLSDVSSGYVPYTGAVNDVDLGAHGLSSTNLSVAGVANFSGSVAINTDPDNNSSGFEYGNGYDPLISNYYNERFRINSFMETPHVSMGVAVNYLLRVEDFSNASWIKTDIGTVTANNQTAPNGALIAENIPAGSTATANVSQAVTNNTTGYWSGGVWARAQSGTATIKLRIDSSSETGTEKEINLDTKWRFYGIKQNFTTANTTKTFRVISGTNAISLWGARLNPGETVNSYYATTSAAYTTPTAGVFFNSNTVYAGTFSGSLSGNASSATYSTGNYGSVTLTNTSNKAGTWELLGYVTLTYNATYSYGQSFNYEFLLKELNNNDSAIPQTDYESPRITLKGNLAAASGNSTTFNNNVPTFSVAINGDTTLTANDVSALVYSTSTSAKVIRLYVKLKNANTHYTVVPVNYGGLSYGVALNGTTSASYLSWVSSASTAVVASLPAPAQGGVVYGGLGFTTYKGNGNLSGTLTSAGFISPKWYPSADSTTALQINKADGLTNILNVDTSNSRIGINTNSPTSYLTLGAGTATANTAPLKLISGTNLTTPETGAFEYNGTDLFFTPTGTTRETFAYLSDLTSGYVPYTGATGAVNLGTNNFSTTGTITSGLINGQTVSSSANFTGTLNVAGVVTLTTDLGVASGGTGASTFTTNGVLYGQGASAIAATAAGTTGQMLLANGTGVPTFVTMSGDATIIASGALALKNTGTAGTYGSATQVPVFTTDVQGRVTGVTNTAITYPGGMTGFANPSATIGLTVANGTATTAMRSDATPALSQAIIPTWTGVHTFSAIPIFNGGVSGTSAPFTVDSNTLVANLNADLLDGHDTSYFQVAGSYLTGEADTLASVTGRGATTATASSFTGGATISGLTMADATNIILNTTTGTKIGTATTQKLAFYNGTPVVQPSGNALTALSTLGLIASPTLTSTNVGLGNVTNAAQLVASTTSTQTGYFGDINLYDDSTPSHYLAITNSSNLTLARTLSINVNDVNRTISLSGDLTVSSAATISGTNTGDETTATIKTKLGTASTSTDGYLTSTDWNTFNNKGSGTVTAVSVASSNGFAGTSSGGATPALTLTTSVTGMLKGNGTAISAATAGTDYIYPSGVAGGQTLSGGTLTTQNLTLRANAADLTTGSVAITTTTASTTTGTGALTVAGGVGVAGRVSALNFNGLTITANGTNTLNIAAGKTLTASNSLTFSGTDSSTLNIGTGGTLGTGAYATIANYMLTSAFTDAAVTGKLLTGYVSGAGTVAATDTILQAIQKLNGNIGNKQDTLVSGTNIKTINSTSLLGSGDIAIVSSPISIVQSSNLFSTGLTGTGNGVTTGAGNSIFLAANAGSGALNASDSVFMGESAGFAAEGANNSIFIGDDAGYNAYWANYSNFFGINAGKAAESALESNFFGSEAGMSATNSQRSNFFGPQAGKSATDAPNSNFMGYYSGMGATSAQSSNFFGRMAGYQATGASYSNFLGNGAGYQTSAASYSNLFGYQAGKFYTGNNIGSNNIIIGTNISLPNTTANAINLGGVIFAKNTYATTTGNPSITAATNGSVGIGVVSPSARLNLPGGQAGAGLAPLKLTAGTNLGTTEAGAVEYDGTHLYFTAANAGTRYQLDQQGGGATVSDDTTTNATVYPIWSATTTGSLTPKVSSTKLSFVPSTGSLSATNFNGVALSTAQGATNFLAGDGTYKAVTGMVYPGAGIPNSTGSAWGTSYTTTGTGTVLALATSPVFTTPSLGVATATSINNLKLSQDSTDFNIKVGENAGLNLVTGAQYNTFIGYEAGKSGSTGGNDWADWNTAIGYQSFYSNTTGSENVAIGENALYTNTTGYTNTAIGVLSMYLNTEGNENTALGYSSLRSNNTGNYNVANGYQSLYSNITGDNNTATGGDSLRYNTTGGNNSAYGYESLYSNTTGIYNSGFGIDSLLINETGKRNTSIGMMSLMNSGKSVTAGSFKVGISYTIKTTGTTNFTLIGAVDNNPGTIFTATGVGSGTGTASSNTDNNVALGYQAGRYAGSGTTANNTSYNSLYVGYDTRAGADGNQNEIVIGYNAIGGGSNTATIGNTSLVRTYLTGVNLKAGTATAGTAPLKLTSGINLTTTEAGAIEYDGTHLYFTAANAGTRYQLDQQGGGATVSDDTTTATPVYPTWSATTTGTLTPKVSSTKLSFVPSTGVLSATGFSGSGASLTSLTAGNLSGTIPSGVLGNSTVYIGTTAVALNRASASLALTGITSIDGYSAAVTLTADNTTNATNYPLFANAATGNLSPRTDTGFTYNPSTGLLGTTALDLTAGNLDVDNTTFANQKGIITKNGARFLHDFNYGNNGTVTTVGENTFIGINSGNLTMGSTATSQWEASQNTGVGYSTLAFSTTGRRNTAIGDSSLYVTTSGSSNTAVGYYSLNNNNTGSSNTALGSMAITGNISGGLNTAVGEYSGGFISDGSTLNTTSDYSVYLGANTKAGADNNQNEIVIGYNAIGGGSNTATIGSTSLVRTYLTGVNLKAGTATAGTAPLKLTAGTNLGTTEAGAVEYDGTHLYFTAANAGTRYQLDQQGGGATVSDDTTTNATVYPIWSATTTGSLTPKVSSTKLSFNPSTGLLGTTALDLTGGSLDLDNTTFANQNGFISKNGSPFIHDFNYGNNGTVTTIGYNLFLGYGAGNATMGSTATVMTQASYNSVLGSMSFGSNTTGYSNTTAGYMSMSGNTTGYSNSSFGQMSLFGNTTGNNNIAFGQNAGSYIANGSTANTTSDNSVYLGNSTKSGADNNQNEIVIGYNAIGGGSNTATIGGSTLVRTYLTGVNLKAGTATAGTAPLKLTAGINLGTTEAGAVEYDGTHLYFTAANAGTRYQLDQQGGGATVSDDTTTATPVYPTWSATTTGTLTPKVSSTKLSFVPSTGVLSATGFSGSGASLTSLTAGNLSGTIPSGVLGNSTVYIGTTAVALNRASASLALTGITSIDGYSAAVTLTADNTTNATNYPLFTNAATGNLSPRTDTGFTYNPSTGSLSATNFNGVALSTGAGATNFLAGDGTYKAVPSSMIYPGAGIPNSTGSAWGTSYTTTGSGTVLALATTPTFTTNITTPLVVGGTSTTQDLSFKTTTGVGATGADMHFLVGTNGGTEAMTILNNGNIGIKTAAPTSLLSVGGPGAGGAALSVHGQSGTYIATFMDRNGEDAFTASGSLLNNDLVVGFGDIGQAYAKNYFTVDTDSTNFMVGRVFIGAETEATSSSKLYITGTTSANGSSSAIAGVLGGYTFNPTAGGVQVGNRFVITNSPTTTANTSIGEIIRTVDSSGLANLVRGLDITSNAGSNTAGTNTGLRASGATFGIQGVTNAVAGGVSVPAAIYGESTGTTQGDVLRLYSDSMTSASSFATFYHESSTFTGTGLLMDFATGSGGFTGNFVDFQKQNTSVFKVTNAGIVSMGLSSTAATSAVCSSLTNGQTPTGGVAYEIRDCNNTPVADYAEMYPTEGDVQYGDIVVAGNNLADTFDTNENGGIDWTKVKGKVAKLVKSNEPYQESVIGIVSDNHNDFSSTGYNVLDEDHPMPIALSGRVPVKITQSSEAIQIGDYLTTSNENGKAMKAEKAGQVIGKALEGWEPNSGKETVMVYVEQGFQNGESMKEFLGLSILEVSEISLSEQILEKLLGSEDVFDESFLSEVFTDRLVAGLEIITPSITTNNLKANGEVEFNGLVFLNGDVEFAKSVKFNDVVEFNVPPLFNKDTAGFAVIKEGARNVRVEFENPYIATPVVTTSITFEKENEIDVDNFFDNDIKSLVVEKDQTGFTIVINQDADEDITFSWIALSVKDATIFESIIEGIVIEEQIDEEESNQTETFDASSSNQVQTEEGATGSTPTEEMDESAQQTDGTPAEAEISTPSEGTNVEPEVEETTNESEVKTEPTNNEEESTTPSNEPGEPSVSNGSTNPESSSDTSSESGSGQSTESSPI